MPDREPIFRGAFPNGEDDEFSDRGVRPVIFDILGPDRETSILPEGVRLVLHVNPTALNIKYARKVERIQTKGGYVEQHWGDDTQGIDIEMASGGFMRLYSGLSNVTSPATTGGSRRETLAYDSYLDMLALFHNNGSVYDAEGQVALQGIIKVTFDAGVYLGWFNDFSVSESADQPHQLTFSCSMSIDSEIQVWRTAISFSTTVETTNTPSEAQVSQATADAAAAAAAQNSPG